MNLILIWLKLFQSNLFDFYLIANIDKILFNPDRRVFGAVERPENPVVLGEKLVPDAWNVMEKKG